MEGDHVKIYYPLIPFSWLYGFGVTVRNIMFECGLLHSESFDVPVISIGNITVGGTGKTPHTEYLIKLLSPTQQVAVLSRGYKRKSKGYILSDNSTPMSKIGDEPFQMKQKFPHIHMAVDKNRRHGIKELCKLSVYPAANVIILDDAYQHRYVTPGVNILLMDYHRLIYFDKLIPAGRLREPRSSSNRADIVIVTKCPESITPTERMGITQSLKLQPWQKIYFTHFKYGNLKSIANGVSSKNKVNDIELSELNDNEYNVLLLTGIASPQQMAYDLEKFCKFTSMSFPDHHDFTRKDIALVDRRIKELESNGKKTIVITTEKDATRLVSYFRQNPSDGSILSSTEGRDFYALPIEVVFMNDKESEFNQFILGYVEKNSINSTLSKIKNANTTKTTNNLE